MAAQRYRSTYGLDEEVLARVAVHQRDNAQANPSALFHGQPITVEDVMTPRYIAEPIKLLESVLMCHGGSALLVANAVWRAGAGTDPSSWPDTAST
jgi:acetyl-CoA acetyltransferase